MDAPLLNGAQRACLHRALRGPNPILALAILKAMEQVGDAQDLAVIEQIVSRGDKNGLDISMLTAARESVSFLRQRMSGERAGETLLRPVDANATHARQLLRGVAPE